MINRQLKKQCKSLAYSKSDRIDEEVFSSTKGKLDELFAEYGHSSVLGALSEVWSFRKSLLFFEKIEFSNKKEKVFTVATSYHRLHEGGVERVVAELMTLWVRMGFKVVLFMEEPENELDYPYPNSVIRLRIPSFDNMEERLDFLEKVSVEEGVDFFINHNWTVLNTLWECILMKYLGIPYVQYCHGHYSWCFDYGYPFFYQPRYFKMCDMILALSETNAKFYQICGCKTFLVNNPVPRDLKIITEKANLNSSHILMVGRIAEEKYPLEALDIFKKVHDHLPNVIFDIVGDGEMLEETREYAKRLGIESTVVFHGKKSAEEIKDFYKESACELFTSKLEGYPMIILETKAYGLPLVMYELPYLTLVKDGKGILSASIGDIDVMADNLINIIENREYRERLGREARESFEHFLQYDQEKDWKTIFELVPGEIFESNYHNDHKNHLTTEGSYVLMILDKANRGYEKLIEHYEQSRDYRIGRFLLSIPRLIKKRKKNL